MIEQFENDVKESGQKKARRNYFGLKFLNEVTFDFFIVLVEAKPFK
jgi:hypothetical protein